MRPDRHVGPCYALPCHRANRRRCLCPASLLEARACQRPASPGPISMCGRGGTGRRAALRSLWPKGRGSSSLLDRTTQSWGAQPEGSPPREQPDFGAVPRLFAWADHGVQPRDAARVANQPRSRDRVSGRYFSDCRRVQAKPRTNRCSAHESGRSVRSNFAAVSVGGCRPSVTALTISGARQVIASSRDSRVRHLPWSAAILLRDLSAAVIAKARAD